MQSFTEMVEHWLQVWLDDDLLAADVVMDNQPMIHTLQSWGCSAWDTAQELTYLYNLKFAN